MREKIACETCELKGKCNDLSPIVDVMPGNKGRPRMDCCERQLERADQILSLTREEIEKIPNPFPQLDPDLTRQNPSLKQNQMGFEDCRQKILAILK